MKKGSAICLLLLLGTPMALSAGGTDTEWSYFDNHSDIRALHQVGDILWIGTNGGILLYDLLSERVVSTIKAGESLPGNSVRTITSRADIVLVGTDHGLSIFTPSDTTVYTAVDMNGLSDVRCIAYGDTGTIYVGTYGHGVVAFDPLRIQHITRKDSLLDNKVYAIAVRDTHTVLFATSLGLCAFRDSVWVSYQAGAGLPRGEMRALAKSDDERYYVLIAGRGIYRFNSVKERAIRIRLRETFIENDVAAIAVDAELTLWAAGRFGGIARYANGHWQAYATEDPDIRDARWRCAAAGSDGVVFFGSSGGLIASVLDGVVRKISFRSVLRSGYVGAIVEDVDGLKFLANGPYLLSTRGDSASLAVEVEVGAVFALIESPAGNVWLSSPWGLLRRSDGEWLQVDPAIEPRAPTFLSLAFGADGHLWAGSSAGEVYRYDGSIWVRYAERYEISGGPIVEVVVDRERLVWALSRDGGVHRFDGAGWTTFEPERFGSVKIHALRRSPSGGVTAISDGTIWRYDHATRQWVQLSGPGPEVGAYRVLYFDAAGRMYLGTTEGLVIFDGEDVRWIKPGDGLRGRNVASILVDREERLWVGFRNDGVAMISLESLH